MATHLRVTKAYSLTATLFPENRTSFLVSFNISTPHATRETLESPVEDSILMTKQYCLWLIVSQLTRASNPLVTLPFASCQCRERGGVGDWGSRDVPQHYAPMQCWKSGEYTHTVLLRVYGVENLTGQFREKDASCALSIFSLNVDYFFLRISVQKHKENI